MIEIYFDLSEEEMCYVDRREERQATDGMIRSDLTVQWIETAKGDRRPVAVMMRNDREAQPQYGINRAGVAYEAPVEGGMNRF